MRGKKGEPVAIGWLERFVADWAAEQHAELEAPPAAPTGYQGGRGRRRPRRPHRRRRAGPPGPRGARLRGPARHRRRAALRHPRVPPAQGHRRRARSSNLRRPGRGDRVQRRSSAAPSPCTSSPRDFDAVFVANGAGLPMFLNIPGENFKGVYSANEYLTRVNLMGAWMDVRGRHARSPAARRVVVFGGGNVAMDAVRTAKRLGAERADLRLPPHPRRDAGPHRGDRPRRGGGHRVPVPRRAAGDPRRREGLGAGRASCSAWSWASPTPPAAAARCPSPGSEFELPCDIVVVALGTVANPLLTNATPGHRSSTSGATSWSTTSRPRPCRASSPAATSCAAAPP